MAKPQMILASTSPRRSMLLKQDGYEFEVVPSHADEKDAQYHDIHQIVTENAEIKGRDVLAQLKDRSFTEPTVLIAADTLVVMGKAVYPKPRDLAEAERFMNELGGQEHQVLTGVFLYRLDTGVADSFYDATDVVLKVMSHGEIMDLLARVNPLDQAAAYGYQDAPEIVERLAGDETNIIGLPMNKLKERLHKICE